jgi:hypothetical protein
MPTTAKEDEEEDNDAADADHLLNPFCELSSLLHFISLFSGVSEKYRSSNVYETVGSGRSDPLRLRTAMLIPSTASDVRG